MSPLDIIRAWKDEDYRLSLTDAPVSPVGLIELTDADMGLLAGGGGNSCECEEECEVDCRPGNQSGNAGRNRTLPCGHPCSNRM